MPFSTIKTQRRHLKPPRYAALMKNSVIQHLNLRIAEYYTGQIQGCLPSGWPPSVSWGIGVCTIRSGGVFVYNHDLSFTEKWIPRVFHVVDNIVQECGFAWQGTLVVRLYVQIFECLGEFAFIATSVKMAKYCSWPCLRMMAHPISYAVLG